MIYHIPKGTLLFRYDERDQYWSRLWSIKPVRYDEADLVYRTTDAEAAPSDFAFCIVRFLAAQPYQSEVAVGGVEWLFFALPQVARPYTHIAVISADVKWYEQSELQTHRRTV